MLTGDVVIIFTNFSGWTRVGIFFKLLEVRLKYSKWEKRVYEDSPA